MSNPELDRDIQEASATYRAYAQLESLTREERIEKEHWARRLNALLLRKHHERSRGPVVRGQRRRKRTKAS